MIGCGLSVVGIWLIGTVFQTALLYLFLPPRLRPGLLSLRSVLASSQIYQQATKHWKQVVGCWLSVIGCIELTNQIPTTNNRQPTTDNRQRI